MDSRKTGTYIRNKRIALGLSQNDLARRLHVTRTAVSRWENGNRFPDSSVLENLSQILHTDIDSIVRGEESDQKVYIVPENVRETGQKRLKRNRMILLCLFILLAAMMIWAYAAARDSDNLLPAEENIRLIEIVRENDHWEIEDRTEISILYQLFAEAEKKENVISASGNAGYESGYSAVLYGKTRKDCQTVWFFTDSSSPVMKADRSYRFPEALLRKLEQCMKQPVSWTYDGKEAPCVPCRLYDSEADRN